MIRNREISAVEAVEAAIRRSEALQPKLNFMVNSDYDRALDAAKKGGQTGPFAGVPFLIKDLNDYAGTPTRNGSGGYRGAPAATASEPWVEAALRAGLIPIGKSASPEFGYLPTTEPLAYGPTRNPWNTSRTTGGSSGGSAAATAAGVVPMAHATDGGGSIRIPAAVCGTVGLKPTYGRVSRVGIASLSWSLDHAGPLARTVGDCAVTLGALAGHDPRDPGSADVPVADYTAELELGVKSLRIGVPRNFFFEHVEPEVAANVRAVLALLEREGAELVEVTIPMADMISPIEFGLCMPEASAYHRTMLRERAHLYEPDVRTFLEAGMLIPAVDYIAALRQRTLMQSAWAAMFDGLDAVIGPAVAAVAMRRDQPTITWPDGVEETASSVFVRLSAPANVTGTPSVSVPCGFGQGGLPTAFQVMGRPFGEARILRIARAYERATDWHTRQPPR
jgi:aspartyl-tRNA(Asn)/glutamyl-tRNA(Gln) amidotransferase subunit A